jgi:hypothetical protein
MLGNLSSTQNSRAAVLDNRGREVIPLGKYDVIWAVDDSNFFIERNDDKKWGVIDHRDSTIIPFMYDWIAEAGSTGFIVTEGLHDGQVSILDTGGKVIFAPDTFEDIWYAGDGFFQVELDARTGIINTRGEGVIEIGRYDYIWAVGKDRFIVRTGDLWDIRLGVVDSRSKVIVPQGIYDDIIPSFLRNVHELLDDGFFVYIDEDVGFVDINGQEIIPVGRYDKIYGVYNGLAIVSKDGEIGVINTKRIMS